MRPFPVGDCRIAPTINDHLPHISSGGGIKFAGAFAPAFFCLAAGALAAAGHAAVVAAAAAQQQGQDDDPPEVAAEAIAITVTHKKYLPNFFRALRRSFHGIPVGKKCAAGDKKGQRKYFPWRWGGFLYQSLDLCRKIGYIFNTV